MIWFGVSDCMSAPALTKMRRPSHHEGVERAVVDDDDLDVLLREAGGAQDRLGVFAQQLLDLGVAQDRRAAGSRSGARRRDCIAERQRQHGATGSGQAGGPAQREVSSMGVLWRLAVGRDWQSVAGGLRRFGLGAEYGHMPRNKLRECG